MKKRFIIATLCGIAFGLITGILGVCIEHYNEGSFGAEYSLFVYDYLAIPSVPGGLISWIQHGSYDWCIDEGWDFRYWTVFWNTVFWSVVFAAAYITIRSLLKLKNRIHQSKEK